MKRSLIITLAMFLLHTTASAEGDHGAGEGGARPSAEREAHDASKEKAVVWNHVGPFNNTTIGYLDGARFRLLSSSELKKVVEGDLEREYSSNFAEPSRLSSAEKIEKINKRISFLEDVDLRELVEKREKAFAASEDWARQETAALQAVHRIAKKRQEEGLPAFDPKDAEKLNIKDPHLMTPDEVAAAVWKANEFRASLKPDHLEYLEAVGSLTRLRTNVAREKEFGLKYDRQAQFAQAVMKEMRKVQETLRVEQALKAKATAAAGK